jgi:Ricin-type beta-trefoil lectin domain
MVTLPTFRFWKSSLFAALVATLSLVSLGVVSSGPAAAATLRPDGMLGAVYEIHNPLYNTCLDSDNSGNVYTNPCNHGAYQKWSLTASSGGYEIQDLQTGRCLDHPPTGGGVITNSCDGGLQRTWTLNNNIKNKYSPACVLALSASSRVSFGSCSDGSVTTWNLNPSS